MLDDPVLVNDWHVVGRASGLAENAVTSARLLGVDLVLWRSPKGVHAWHDMCRHRGAKLSLGTVRDGCLVCSYHGWCYDGSGSCTLIPAHSSLTHKIGAKARTFHARVRYGLVWVCLGIPKVDVPSFREWGDPSYKNVHAGPTGSRPAPRVSLRISWTPGITLSCTRGRWADPGTLRCRATS